MPTAALRPCRAGCASLVGPGRPCPTHPKVAWHRPPSAPPPKRIRGTTLQNLRKRLFANEPLCRTCASVGRVTVATIRDHILNLKAGGSDTEDNVQPLCQTCSDIKTAEESRRGISGWRQEYDAPSQNRDSSKI